MTRWRGVVDLLQDAVHHGAIGVERVHQRVARTPLDVAARLPPLAPAARRIAAVQARIIATTYASVREVNALVAPLVGALVETAVGARAAADDERRAPPGTTDENGSGAARPADGP